MRGSRHHLSERVENRSRLDGITGVKSRKSSRLPDLLGSADERKRFEMLFRRCLTRSLSKSNTRQSHPRPRAQTRRTANVELVTEDVIFIHPEDAADNGIEDSDIVCVESERGKVDIKARVSDEIKRGVLSATFHFPEVLVNDLTSSISDSEAMCPEYKVVSVKIRKARRVADRV